VVSSTSWWERTYSPYSLSTETDDFYTNIEFIDDLDVEDVSCYFEPYASNAMLLREEELGRVVRDEFEFDNLEDEMKDFNNRYAYEKLASYPELLNLGNDEDAIYQNYFNLLENSNISISREVASLFSSGDLSGAMLKNQELFESELIYSNEKIVNDMYLTKYINDSIPFNQSDSLILTEIAVLTPYIGGESVYSARIMMGIDVSDYSEMEYRVDGDTTGSDNTIEVHNILQFPNPVDNKLHFTSTINNGSYKVVVYDIKGEEILRTEFNSELILDTSGWIGGVYTYSIIGMNKIKNGKFIIIH